MTAAANDPRICEGRSRYWWSGYDDRMRAKPYSIQTTGSDWRAGWATADHSHNDIGIMEGVDCFLVNIPDLKDVHVLNEVVEWMKARGVETPPRSYELCLTRGRAGQLTVFALPTYELAFEFFATFG
jgi:hypothetical protein